jgi:hypothetical protein
MVSGLAIVGKRLVNKEGQRPHEQAVGGGSVSAAHCFFMAPITFFVDQPFADNRQA